MRRPLLLLLPVLLLLTGTPARAVDTKAIAAALRTGPVYQAPGVTLLDPATVAAELTSDTPRVVVAVLAAGEVANDPGAQSQAAAIGRDLQENELVVLVVTADGYYGAATGRAAALRGVDARAALAAERAAVQGEPFGRDTVTALVASFAQRVAGQAATDRSVPVRSQGGQGRWVGVLGLLLLGAGLLAVPAWRRRRTRT